MQSPTLIDLKSIGDERGFFCELWRDEDLFKLTGVATWAQANWSRSTQNVIRGLHFQLPPHAQAKLVWVTSGVVHDVCLDIRANSKHYGKVYEFELNADKPQLLFVPVGFAHGFCTQTEKVDFLYRCSAEYCRDAEGGVLCSDPELNIRWPKQDYKLSDRDQKWPSFKEQDAFFKSILWESA